MAVVVSLLVSVPLEALLRDLAQSFGESWAFMDHVSKPPTYIASHWDSPRRGTSPFGGGLRTFHNRRGVAFGFQQPVEMGKTVH